MFFAFSRPRMASTIRVQIFSVAVSGKKSHFFRDVPGLHRVTGIAFGDVHLLGQPFPVFQQDLHAARGFVRIHFIQIIVRLHRHLFRSAMIAGSTMRRSVSCAGPSAPSRIQAATTCGMENCAETKTAAVRSLQNLGRHKEALDCYDRLIALKPEDPLPWLLRGSALNKLARHQDALSSCEKAIELNPREARAWSDRGAIFLSTGRTDDALACFEKVTELEPANAFGWISRGMALSDLGCFQESLASFARAADLDPGNEMAHIYCCAAFIELKDFEPALAHVDRALEIAPDHPLAWAVRSTALAAAGRYRDALHAVERALELGEGSSFLYFKRAEILFAEDRWREGSTALDEALGRFYRVENPDAGNTVAIIRLLQRFLHDESGLRLRIKVLVLTYYKHRALPTLAHALVEFIPELLTPAFQDHTAHRWLDQWRGLTEARPEFRLPLRLVAAAVSYRETRDLRVLMELPLEERILLEPLLGVEVQATA